MAPECRKVGPEGAGLVCTETEPDSRDALLRAAFAALEEVRMEMESHAINLEIRGIGLYQGTEYHPTAKQEKKDKAKSSDRVEIRETNCITLLKDAVVAYQDARLQPWGPITKRTEDAADRGVTLLKEFRQRAGATTVYVSAPGDRDLKSAKKTHLGPSKAPLVRGIHSKTKYDVRLPLDQFISQKEAATKLRDVPFGLGLTVDNWGEHTFVYSYGSVYEVHYHRGPRSKKVFEQSTLDAFMAEWGSVVIAVPHGPWNFGEASPAPRK